MVYVAPRSVAVLILSVYPHLINEAVELDVCQGLPEAVSNHLISWNVGELDSSCSHLVTDVVMLDIDMFCLGVEDKVVCKCD